MLSFVSMAYGINRTTYGQLNIKSNLSSQFPSTEFMFHVCTAQRHQPQSSGSENYPFGMPKSFPYLKQPTFVNLNALLSGLHVYLHGVAQEEKRFWFEFSMGVQCMRRRVEKYQRKSSIKIVISTTTSNFSLWLIRHTNTQTQANDTDSSSRRHEILD